MAERHSHGGAWAIVAVVAMIAASVPVLPSVQAGATIDVFEGESIQDAVDSASPGDTILIHAGTYREALLVTTPDITLAGEGQGVTVLEGLRPDGSKIGTNAIKVEADGVTVRDLSIQNYRGNGVFYDGVDGFLVERVTATDNGPYGIYAIRSSNGVFRDSEASGHSDSGFYLGENSECYCLIENVWAYENLIGYSGTGAGEVTIRDSLWEHNAAGIVPNVLPTEPQLQTRLVVENNVVRDNNNAEASEAWHFSGGFHVPDGMGIVIAGGIEDTVADNQVTGHTLGGIVVVWLFMEPSLNQIVDNTVDNPAPGVDILWDGGGVNNCFEGNVNPTGGVTFDAGEVWNTAGFLPDCSTPNAAPPSPTGLARILSMLAFRCEPTDHPDDPCHSDHLG